MLNLFLQSLDVAAGGAELSVKASSMLQVKLSYLDVVALGAVEQLQHVEVLRCLVLFGRPLLLGFDWPQLADPGRDLWRRHALARARSTFFLSSYSWTLLLSSFLFQKFGAKNVLKETLQVGANRRVNFSGLLGLLF